MCMCVRACVCVSMCVCVCVTQEYAVRTFKKKRGPGDLTKAPEFDKARSDLEIAMRYFEHLNALGPASSKLDQKKLESHIKFCKETMQKVCVMAHIRLYFTYFTYIRTH